MSIGFRSSLSLLSAIQATGLLTSTPTGLSPAKHASLCWTHPELQKYLKALLRVLFVATTLTGDQRRAAYLLRNEPLRAFEGKTADTLIEEGRAQAVIDYLQSFEGGAAG